MKKLRRYQSKYVYDDWILAVDGCRPRPYSYTRYSDWVSGRPSNNPSFTVMSTITLHPIHIHIRMKTS